MKRAVFVLANIAVAIVGGWWLAQFVATLPYEMPQWLDSAIRAGIRITGSVQFDNTDDIETIAAIMLFVACSALVGLVLAGINLAFRRCLVRRRRRS
ncbi:hypothetical protein B0G76_1131 [Paraburkholderia sp. BL23I1N1]|uniref:hypothetical protein n=1 Tax=Paraburkholderia sp. BL23I1N1 TaxID=1938802 RepID=UPI000E746619|nr:hypothetical protein [Paraburkholderia sp. BL23I1N1]RKE35083.1 hypothetical protein B0G76_1131 [Paraburkholderia sp. BL23I1N1]